ncbi:MAG: hypothetical protein BGO07_04510 [Alphaproteobacteria bacterium 40-19]|nr:MAG: hypothetical protein BGO07_04510 [Alphaproteobacteria bacterium 40-19]
MISHVFFKKFISLYHILAFGLMAEVCASDSIQGKTYPDHINGFYDRTITDQMIASYLPKLQEAVQTDDPDKISAFIHYPCNLNLRKSGSIGEHKKIKAKEDFKVLFPKIFTPDIKNLILKTTLSDLFVNAQGFMMGDGTVWFIPKEGCEGGMTTFNLDF